MHVDPGNGTEEFDSVDMAVISSRFTSIVRKMSNTLIRAGRSVILNTGRDFSCCVLSGADEMLAMAESIPVHVLSGPDLMAASMRDLHADVKPGDAFLHNSPYHGSSHPADLSILVPVFDDENRHRFTVLSKAHVADIGNAEPTAYPAMARDVYEEGAVIFPCVQVQRNYEDIADVIRMCRVRIRAPDMWWGDYLALLGSARVGERQVRQLASEIGWDRLDSFVNAWFDYSEALMAAAIARLPNGEITVHARHDPFGRMTEGIPIDVGIVIGDEHIEIDLTNNPDCQPCGLNTTEATARSAALLGVFNSINGAAPPTAGSFRRVNVKLRENCVVGIPRHPASCGVATCNMPDRIGNAVQRGIAELAEGHGMAEVGLSVPASVSVLSGRDPRHGGEPFVDQIVLAWTGGAGAPKADGWLTMGGIGDAGVLQRDSVELDELRFPIRIETQRLVPDTEGAGRRRGAPAAEAEITAVDAQLEAIYLSDGTLTPPLGARGGQAGAPAWQALRRVEGTVTDIGIYERLTIGPGETLLSRCCGGGGYGDPHAREPERVRADVEEGLITRDRASSVYGVILDGDLRLDLPATVKARASLDTCTTERASPRFPDSPSPAS